MQIMGRKPVHIHAMGLRVMYPTWRLPFFQKLGTGNFTTLRPLFQRCLIISQSLPLLQLKFHLLRLMLYQPMLSTLLPLQFSHKDPFPNLPVLLHLGVFLVVKMPLEVKFRPWYMTPNPQVKVRHLTSNPPWACHPAIILLAGPWACRVVRQTIGSVFFSEVDTQSSAVGTGFLNHRSSSLGERLLSSSHNDNDSMDFD